MVHVGKYTSPIDSMGKESQTQKVHLDQPNCVLFTGRIGNPLHEAFFVWSWTSGQKMFFANLAPY